MTGHRTLLYSDCVDVGNGYNFLRTMNNIHLNMNAKPYVRGILDGSDLIVSNIKKQRIQKWNLHGDTHGSSRGIHTAISKQCQYYIEEGWYPCNTGTCTPKLDSTKEKILVHGFPMYHICCQSEIIIDQIHVSFWADHTTNRKRSHLAQIKEQEKSIKVSN